MRGPLRAASVAFCALVGVPEAVSAAHPFITDDTNTQGAGRFELQLGTQYARTDAEGVTLGSFQFAPQLSYGIASPIDLIIRPTYNVNLISGGESGRNSGWCDTNLEVKWRVFARGPVRPAAPGRTGVASRQFSRRADARVS